MRVIYLLAALIDQGLWVGGKDFVGKGFGGKVGFKFRVLFRVCTGAVGTAVKMFTWLFRLF